MATVPFPVSADMIKYLATVNSLSNQLKNTLPDDEYARFVNTHNGIIAATLSASSGEDLQNYITSGLNIPVPAPKPATGS